MRIEQTAAEAGMGETGHWCGLSLTSWRGWAGFLLGRVQFVGMLARQVRACTSHARVRDPSPAGLDDSYHACLHNAAVFIALAPHTHPTGW